MVKSEYSDKKKCTKIETQENSEELRQQNLKSTEIAAPPTASSSTTPSSPAAAAAAAPTTTTPKTTATTSDHEDAVAAATPVSPSGSPILKIEKNGLDACEAEEVATASPSSSPPFVVKTPRTNSKLILQNMEEVLNSVKKKHRQKHRRKKEQKKLAMLEAEAAAAAGTAAAPNEHGPERPESSQAAALPNIDEGIAVAAAAAAATQKKKERKEKRHHHHHQHKKPLQDKAAQNNGGVEQASSTSAKKASSSSSTSSKHSQKPQQQQQRKSSPLKGAPVAPESASILKHFPRTPKKGEAAAESVAAPPSLPKSSKPSTATTNAFEFMMNARNKSIGSNTPGKEPSPTTTPDVAAGAHVKRKLLLQDWADKKGGAKRKIDDEARGSYVEKQLENRAKRFKKMLVRDGSPKTSNSTPNTKNNKPDQSHNENSGKGRKSKKQPTPQEQPPEQLTAPAKRVRGRPRTRRLSSVDSTKSLDHESTPAAPDTAVTAEDTETAEFLSKLNSPTKKRDSLLGYFQKKESPKDATAKLSKVEAQKPKEKVQLTADNDVEAAPKATETPKGRPRRGATTAKKDHTATKMTTTAEEEETTARAAVVDDAAATTANTATTVTTSSNTNSPSGSRPKRSCAGKTRYDYDLDKSPAKTARIAKSTPLRPATTPAVAPLLDDSEVEIIDLDHSNSMTSLQTPKKLAPLFVRRTMPKPSPDPALLKARQDFLRSGVPEKLLLEKAKQKQHEQSYEESLELFPKVAHVRQWSADEAAEMQAEKNDAISKFTVKFRQIEDDNEEKEKRKSKSRGRLATSLGCITGCTGKDFRLTDKTPTVRQTSSTNTAGELPPIENKRSIIKKWKTDFDRFPTYKCYNQMREKYRYFSAVDSAQDTEQVTESFVVTRRTRRSLEAQQKFDPNAAEERPPTAAPNGELLFSEKYKPLLFEQVLVNLTPVTQLREFLAAWSNGSGAASARNSQQALIDDSMDFMNDSNSSQQAACNSVVLLGPGSSGKTNAVFALANEMNFNVLEINAGMKRTGKRLIQELQEATQSHQIRKESLSSSQGACGGGGKSQKNLLKMSLNGLKSKKQVSQSSSTNNNDADSSSSAELSQSASRKCLILIEDADIVFEQTDAGFTDAIYTLAASSKRPVIVVANNPNCQHLQRLMHQNTIRFTAPNVLNISKFLCVLSLIENCPIHLDDLISLYLYNGKDLRRTLLELQFFVQSGGDRQRLALLESSKNKQAKEKKQREEVAQFYASPSKRRFSEEPSVTAAAAGPFERENSAEQPNAEDSVYMHRTLFEFYTAGQNERVRIPFPADFRLLRLNLNDVFQVSQNLMAQPAAVPSAATATKRRTRSPKKLWLCSATKTTAAAAAATKQLTPLANLCEFYENASVAALLGASEEHFADRLVPHLAEHIAHNLLEQAIAVNLAADATPYNLFDTPVERLSLCSYLGSTSSAMRNKSARSLDYEPNLRAICRSEKLRSTQERRSTRFYHYLRNTAASISNFSMEHYDSACDILQDAEAATNQT